MRAIASGDAFLSPLLESSVYDAPVAGAPFRSGSTRAPNDPPLIILSAPPSGPVGIV